MLFDIPTTISLSEVNLSLPSSEEEWSANTSTEWSLLHASPTSPPTPTFKEAFQQLFADDNLKCIHQYSEFRRIHHDFRNFVIYIKRISA